jgi:hypothetical protein
MALNVRHKRRLAQAKSAKEKGLAEIGQALFNLRIYTGD